MCDSYSNTSQPSQELLAANDYLLRLQSGSGYRPSASAERVSLKWLDNLKPQPEPQPEPQPQPQPQPQIKIYPSIAIQARVSKQTPVYRLWKWLQYKTKSGWLDLQEIRENIEIELGLGWKRARQLLNEGNGRYWTHQYDRETNPKGFWAYGRLWLKGARDVASALGVVRLSGKPVYMPLKTILDGISAFDAAIYASFHSGRKNDRPISQQTISDLYGIPERTQRHYCNVADIERVPNYKLEKGKHKEQIESGSNSFVIHDKKGRIGQKYDLCVVSRLPNTYHSPLAQAPKGRQQKINKQLVDPVINEARGNGKQKVDRVFFQDGKQAAKAHSKQSNHDHFWPDKNNPSLWHSFTVI